MSAVERLALAGEAAFGADWQRPMARALGPHHPRRATRERDAIDDRLVRRWVAGDRPVPAWVGAALPAVLREYADVLAARGDGLRRLADALARANPGDRADG